MDEDAGEERPRIKVAEFWPVKWDIVSFLAYEAAICAGRRAKEGGDSEVSCQVLWSSLRVVSLGRGEVAGCR